MRIIYSGFFSKARNLDARNSNVRNSDLILFPPFQHFGHNWGWFNQHCPWTKIDIKTGTVNVRVFHLGRNVAAGEL